MSTACGRRDRQRRVDSSSIGGDTANQSCAVIKVLRHRDRRKAQRHHGMISDQIRHALFILRAQPKTRSLRIACKAQAQIAQQRAMHRPFLFRSGLRLIAQAQLQLNDAVRPDERICTFLRLQTHKLPIPHLKRRRQRRTFSKGEYLNIDLGIAPHRERLSPTFHRPTKLAIDKKQPLRGAFNQQCLMHSIHLGKIYEAQASKNVLPLFREGHFHFFSCNQNAISSTPSRPILPEISAGT